MRIVDLFCGGGGLSYGMAQAGHTIVAAYDWWKPALDFYNRNIHDHYAYQLDLSDVQSAVKEVSQWRPDAIIGGPPCQDFSSAGKRDEKGGRASLTISYAMIVTTIRPRMFVMENVDRAIKTRTYRNALRMFKEAGYDLAIAVLDASLCGVPQARKRIVVVGGLGISVASVIDIYRQNQAHRPMTVREYFGPELDLDYYYRHPRSYARRGIFSVDEPSPTIRGVNRPIPQGYPGHAGDAAPVATPGLRPLSTRERSRIQTFPAHWDLCGNKSDIEQIIGNAVPCALGEFVGRAIAAFDERRHERLAEINNESVTVFLQHERPAGNDMQEVALEAIDHALIKEATKPTSLPCRCCQSSPAQMLLAVDKGNKKLAAKQKTKGLAGTKYAARRKPAKGAVSKKRCARSAKAKGTKKK